MINLQRNREFDEMIKEIRKARFFKFSKEQLNKSDVDQFINDLDKESYEDYMMMKSGDMDVTVYGPKEGNKITEVVALVDQDSSIMVINIEGMINIAKLPKIVNSFQSEDFINVFELKGFKGK
jgi:hypothetical protein